MTRPPKVLILNFPRIEFVQGRRVKNPTAINPGNENALSLNVNRTEITYSLKASVEHIGSIDSG